MVDTRRIELLDKLADFVLTEGLSAASLRPLAKAAGTSDRMLLYYFKDKSELLAAVLGHIAARLQPLLDAAALPLAMAADDLLEHLQQELMREALWPYMQLWLDLASHAARGDETCRSVGHQLAEGFIDWLTPQIEGGARADAYRVLAAFEGRVLLSSFGLTAPGGSPETPA